MGLLIVGPHGSTGKFCGTCGAAMCTCGTCTIPQANLTLSYSNLIIGNGTTPLVYAGGASCQWNSGCTNQLLYQLICTGGRVEFRVYYFLSGTCPTGQSQYCSTLRSAPSGLTQTGLTCGSSFLLTCTLTSSSCPNISSYGYTGFSASYP